MRRGIREIGGILAVTTAATVSCSAEEPVAATSEYTRPPASELRTSDTPETRLWGCMFDATRAAITWTMQTGDGSESQYSRPSDVPGLDPSSVEIVQRTDANQQPQVTFRYSIGLGAQYGLLGALTVQINPGETPRAALEHSDSTLAYPAAGTQPRLARVEPLLRIEYDSDTISTTRDAKTACALADEIEAYVK